MPVWLLDETRLVLVSGYSLFAEGPRRAQRKRIKAAGEERNSDEQQHAGGLGPRRRLEKADGQQAERVPGVVLDRRVPDGEHVGREPRLEPVRAESAETYRNRSKQRAEGEEHLQAGFFAFLFGRPGRFLP